MRRHLDLVALATIADVVPLVDENRALASAGLRTLAGTSRPGLQALMRAARVDPAAVDSGAVGFRLAPRINAAGRLCRPDVALELVLTEDADEAKRLAGELEDSNRERQGVEDRILREATALVESMPEPSRRRRGYVLWREDWHEGVIGIVASRLVERFHRPVVLIAGSHDGCKGSGRSVARFDLHAALGACSTSGPVRRPPRCGRAVDRSVTHRCVRRGLCRVRGCAPRAGGLHEPTSVDAVVSAADLTLELAQELERLAPFGLGNPDVTLLVPATQPVTPSTVGEGKHLRFRVRQHGRDAGTAIAFGQGGQLDRLRAEGLFDVACRLKENHWNGTVSPQLGAAHLRHARRVRGAASSPRRALAHGREVLDRGGPPYLRGADSTVTATAGGVGNSSNRSPFERSSKASPGPRLPDVSRGGVAAEGRAKPRASADSDLAHEERVAHRDREPPRATLLEPSSERVHGRLDFGAGSASSFRQVEPRTLIR